MILLLSAAEVFGADSTGVRNAGSEGVAMGRPRGWGSAMTGRPVMRSPGHPSGWRREHKQRFWAGIARGVSSDDAAIEADVSIPVGVRWFREGGGMPAVTRAPLLGRYLSFAEREEIAILRAPGSGCAGDRAGGESFTVDDLRGAAPKRDDSRRQLGLSSVDGTVAFRQAREASEGCEAGRQRATAQLCAGASRWRCGAPRREKPAGASGSMDRASSRAAQGSAVGEGVEP